jgi:hypothetical protein
MMRTKLSQAVLLLAACAATSLVAAALPAPTPAAQAAAATKKAAADAQAAKDKENLVAAMESLSQRWRKNAASSGWTVHPPVAMAALAPAQGGQPAQQGQALSGAVPAAVQTTGVATTGTPMPGVSPRVTGVSANTLTGTPAGKAAASPGGGAAPRSAQALDAARVPVKSEKLGTATPSADIKKVPTQSVPAGASPALDKGNARAIKNQ